MGMKSKIAEKLKPWNEARKRHHLFEERAEAVELRRGSYPAGVRHRVPWTDPAQKTVWLAIHYGSESF
jgi:hypothetical protein